MTMDRRAFLERSAAGLAISTLAAGSSSTLSADSGKSIQLDVTGLLAMQLWTKDQKRAEVACVDGMKTIQVPHVAMLIADLDDCVVPGDEGFPPNDAHRGPQVVRLGNHEAGIWSLANYALWVNLGEDKSYPGGKSGTFDFPKRSGDLKKGPMPLENEEAWAGREWFLDMCEIVESPRVDQTLVSSRIHFRYGTASGRAPKSRCERERKYRFEDRGPDTLRTVGAEIKIMHPAPKDGKYAEFRLARLLGTAREPDPDPGTIILLRTA